MSIVFQSDGQNRSVVKVGDREFAWSRIDARIMIEEKYQDGTLARTAWFDDEDTAIFKIHEWINQVAGTNIPDPMDKYRKRNL